MRSDLIKPGRVYDVNFRRVVVRMVAIERLLLDRSYWKMHRAGVPDNVVTLTSRRIVGLSSNQEGATCG